ncbi:MAG: hypothetical protein ABIA04_16040 [Pseudomonadota bacterium]
MSNLLAIDCRFIANDLYTLLGEIDPARWNDDLEHWAEQKLEIIRKNLNKIKISYESSLEHPNIVALHKRICELCTQVEESLPDQKKSIDLIKSRWNQFRIEIIPAYEQLIKNLKTFDIHVPSLRPTNYARNLFHVTNGFIVLIILQHLLSNSMAIYLSAAFVSTCWFLEFIRRQTPQLNKIIMAPFVKLAHPHEKWRVNSATWFSTSLFILALIQNKAIASIAIIVLATADPAAAIIGRRFGRICLANGRSLEGSLTFWIVGTITASIALLIYYPNLSFVYILALSSGGALAGCLAELFSRKIDDNISVPIATALCSLTIMNIITIF